MTPINVGEYTVHESPGYKLRRGRLVEDGETIYCVVTAEGHPYRYVNTLPMALRVAAEAAGIERQRVEVAEHPMFPGEPSCITSEGGYTTAVPVHAFWGHHAQQNWLGTWAHNHARARYAAPGGAA